MVPLNSQCLLNSPSLNIACNGTQLLAGLGVLHQVVGDAAQAPTVAVLRVRQESGACLQARRRRRCTGMQRAKPWLCQQSSRQRAMHTLSVCTQVHKLQPAGIELGACLFERAPATAGFFLHSQACSCGPCGPLAGRNTRQRQQLLPPAALSSKQPHNNVGTECPRRLCQSPVLPRCAQLVVAARRAELEPWPPPCKMLSAAEQCMAHHTQARHTHTQCVQRFVQSEHMQRHNQLGRGCSWFHASTFCSRVVGTQAQAET